MFEVLVAGGGPAGLNAAQTLGRQRRRALLVDSGEPRNAPASEMHMFLSRDGFPPSALRRIGRAELAEYPTVEVRDGLITGLRGTIDDFTAEFADGSTARARRVILATGQVDALPEIDGVAGLFGKGLYHCPFCHGFEAADRPLAVLGGDFSQSMLALYLADRFAKDVVLCANGPLRIGPELREALDRAGIAVREDPVVRLAGADGDVTVEFATGEPLTRAAVFHRPAQRQHADLAAGLGCELLPDGCVRVDAAQRTTVPGVYAAGDTARQAELPGPTPFVITGAADGAKAAIWLEQELFRAGLDVPVPG
jgi:thioredoxin reductase